MGEEKIEKRVELRERGRGRIESMTGMEGEKNDYIIGKYL